MIYLDLADLLHIAHRTLGAPAAVRDPGLLEAAAARPQTIIFGDDAYPDLPTKAATLTQSLVTNHPLVDGNKRLGLAALIAFLGLNGLRLTWTNDEAYQVIVSMAAGHAEGAPGTDLDALADLIARSSRPWPGSAR